MRSINLHNDRHRKRIERVALPQTCQLIIQSASFNAAGMRSKSVDTRVIYKGSSSIACRLDVSKHYRQADIEGQEVVVSEFTLHLPRDVEPSLDTRVVVDGVAYEIRKMLEQQAWDVTTMALLVRVNKPSLTLPVDAITDGEGGYLITGTGGKLLIG